MKTFLSDCVDDILRRGVDTSDLCIVLPSKRAATFMVRDFVSNGSKPMILPDFITINDLFERISGLTIADNCIITAKLYLLYIKHLTTDESFDQFVSWGTMLINDFDDIDKYLVDPKEIFANIKSLKEIDLRFSYLDDKQLSLIRRFWGAMVGDKLSEEQKSLSVIWEKILPIYQELRDELIHNSMAYEGMAFRAAVEKLTGSESVSLQHKTYAFIGFNALNKCEKELMLWLQMHGKALFYWDSDPYYFTHDWCEAGYFIRQNVLMFPCSLPNVLEPKLKDKDVELMQCPSVVAQVKQIPSILAEWVGSGHDLSSCAIVLCDESLLLPLIHSLPPWVDNVNITMGYPLKISQAAASLSLLLRLQRNAQRGYFLFNDVLEIIQSPLLKLILPRTISDFIESRKWHKFDKVPHSSINSYCPLLFYQVSDGYSLLAYLRKTCQNIVEKINDGLITDLSLDVQRECFFSIFINFNRIELIIMQEPLLGTVPLTTMLINDFLSSAKVSFVGEPLRGLQVMGILESRVLDFDKVIMLSVNEGQMPSSSVASSYVPFNLRQGFEMPTVKERDAIYAYYFYRLLHRASSATLAYVSGGIKPQEKSRYLQQIEYDDAFFARFTNVQLTLKPYKEELIQIDKTADIIKQLRDDFCGSGRGLSAKALNTYIDCRLKFYYQYIKHIKSEDEIDELPDHITFGNVFHKAMQVFYTPFVNKVLDNSFFEHHLNDNTMIEQAIRAAFVDAKLSAGKSQEIDGYYEIIFNVVKQYVYHTVNLDSSLSPLIVRELEFPLPPLTRAITVRDDVFDCKLYGLADRIDQARGCTRIVDYKTGKRSNSVKNIGSLFEMDADVTKRNDKVFQSLYYSLLYKKVSGEEKVRPELIFVRENAVSQNTSIIVGNSVVEDISGVEEELLEGLDALLNDIFDCNIPFTQNTRACVYCEFAAMCGKTTKPKI